MEQDEERFAVGAPGYLEEGYELAQGVEVPITKEQADQYVTHYPSYVVVELPRKTLDELEETRRDLIVTNARQKQIVAHRKRIFESIEWPQTKGEES